MKHFIFTATLVGALASPLIAAAQDGQGREIANVTFESMEGSERGFVDQGTYLNFGSDIFFSMDYDGDNTITLHEFLDWDAGMSALANEVGRADSYETAKRVVFAFWDRNGDGELSRTEHRQSLNADFVRADQNNDAVLDKDEFTGGFSLMVAARAAINPTPAE